jgi:hypothetical protein
LKLRRYSALFSARSRPMQAIVEQFQQTFKDHPPRAKPAGFNLDHVLQKMREASRSNAPQIRL